MTIEMLIASIEADKDSATTRAQKTRENIEAILAEAHRQGREFLTPEEDAEAERLFEALEKAKADEDKAERKLVEARKVKADEDRINAQSGESHLTPAGQRAAGGTAAMRVTPRPGTDGTMLYGSPVAADGPSWRYADTGRNAAVERGQRFADHETAREYADRQAEHDRIVIGTHGGLAQQIRALTTSGASAIVPTEWSFPIIDKVRNNAVVYQAGAVSVPMPAKIVQIGRLTTDPTATFRTEGSAITASDPAFDYVQLTATTLSALTVASLEFLQDAPNADQVVSEAIAKTMALELDKAAMFGQLGATGTNDEGAAYGLASPYPKGILKNLLDNAAGQVLGFATNGTAQTAATPWNEILALYFQMVTQNEHCNVVISNAKMVQQYASLYDTTNQPLRKPAIVDGLPWLVTNTIPSYTRGTMTSRASDVFAGDFSQVLIGERMQLEVQVLTERYAELGQVGILAYWRGDVQVARPKALACYRALQGAA